MAEISTLAQQYGFKIIEDASHAIGSTYLGKRVGGGHYSDITVFSFHPVKIITSGEGGMAVSNCPGLANRMRRLRSHGLTSDQVEMHSRPESEIWNYQQIGLGLNYRMTDIHAALGVSQFTRLEKYVAKRRVIADQYDTALSKLPIILPKQHENTRSAITFIP